MNGLDLFCGLKGASAAWLDRGWSVLTVDIESRFEPDVVADLMDWHYDGPPVDLLWASPPCTEFSKLDKPWFPDADKPPDMALVLATLRLVGEIEPRFWIIENVRGLQRWFGRAPARFGSFYLWGWYPPIPAPRAADWLFKDIHHVRSPRKRAKIPYGLSDAVARGVEVWTG